MKLENSMLTFLLAGAINVCGAQGEPLLEPATPAILRAFQSHDIVMLGEVHGNKQQYDWLLALVATPEFGDRVDDIVMEFGNSRYQETVDRYIRGEEIPLEQVQGAWLDTVATVGPPAPVYASVYHAVRETNVARKGKRQLRVLCGDPAIDWTQVNEAKDLLPYLRSREESYAQVVKNEVIARHRRALLIMGTFHFLRHFDRMPSRKQFDIEQQLRAAGANPYLIVAGTNTTGGAAADPRFDAWHAPVIVSLIKNWVGALPAIPVVTQGRGPSLPELTMRDAADALLYLGPKDSLTTVPMPRASLEGTAYGRELERRRAIQMALEK